MSVIGCNWTRLFDDLLKETVLMSVQGTEWCDVVCDVENPDNVANVLGK